VSFGAEEAASGVRLKAGLGSDLVSQLFGETRSNKFRGAPGFPFEVNLGYLKSVAQAECYRVFDKMVERASREMKRGLWPE